MQAFGLSADEFELVGTDFSILHDVVKLRLQHLTLFDQFVAEGRSQNSGRDCKDTDSGKRHHHRHGPPDRCYRINIAVAYGCKCDNRPVNGGRDIFIFVRLRLMLKQKAQRRGHDDQQNHDEGRRADDGPFTRKNSDQRDRRIVAAGQLQQPRQPEYPQEPQIEYVVQQAFQEKRQYRQEVDKRRHCGGLLEPASDGAFKAGLFHAGVHAHEVLDSEDSDHHCIQDDKLDIEHVAHALYRFHDDGKHRKQHAQRDESVKKLLQSAAIAASEHQRVHLLAQRTALIGFRKIVVRRDENAK